MLDQEEDDGVVREPTLDEPVLTTVWRDVKRCAFVSLPLYAHLQRSRQGEACSHSDHILPQQPGRRGTS